jgi:hypothetical protein
MEEIKNNLIVELPLNELKEVHGGAILLIPSKSVVGVIGETIHTFIDFTEGLMSGYNQTKK